MEEFFLEKKSKFSFNKTITEFTNIVQEGGWKVVYVHDLQETMARNNKEVLPVKVLELCSPSHAYSILGKDEWRTFSSMMPCRISIYEKSDGNTYVSQMNISMLAPLMEKEIQGIMNISYAEVQNFVSRIIEN
ncbi:MAG TPA: DUF302 domain-containing protein [Paludibacteraceae bacterium]|jgi:uncharacterized protein (DUF302 family)|nr:DUF302 domain-containing protein [Paludibacteraceae bacterium]